jgi:PST family polysaccharide transporter
LSVAVFLGLVASGQGALLQGVRRISDLAKVGIWGAVLGSVASVMIVYFMREDGIVPSIVAISAIGCLLSWWYTRRIRIAAPDMSFSVVRNEASALLRLGIAFLASSLLMMGAAYLVRIIVLRADGLEGAGLYQAGWTLGGMYVGFVLQAMGTDFYPRLVANVHDRDECNRLVNEQAHVSILLAGPGVLGTLVLSPWLVSSFYSASFEHAGEVLRWICIGMALRVVTWPMGFIIVAKNRQLAYIATELAWTVVNLGLSWVLVQKFGLTGAGMAFFASYIFHAALIYPVVRRMTGFTWSSETFQAISLFVVVIGVVFVVMLVPTKLGTAVGFAALLGSCFYSIRQMLQLVDHSTLPRGVLRILSLFRVSSSDAGHS